MSWSLKNLLPILYKLKKHHNTDAEETSTTILAAQSTNIPKKLPPAFEDNPAKQRYFIKSIKVIASEDLFVSMKHWYWCKEKFIDSKDLLISWALIRIWRKFKIGQISYIVHANKLTPKVPEYSGMKKNHQQSNLHPFSYLQQKIKSIKLLLRRFNCIVRLRTNL